MEKKNKVFIATSLDGYIADKDGGIEWLESIPELNTIDTGYAAFTAEIDALVMGRNTFETVCSFDIEWPYKKPVFVLSKRLNSLPEEYQKHATLLKGSLPAVLQEIHQQGLHQLYIDGGQVIQSFLSADLIDEMIITTIPVLLGSGIPLFGDLEKSLQFECVESKLFLKKVAQHRYIRKKEL